MLDAATAAKEIPARLRAGSLMPYLGPGLAELAAAPVPTTHEELADYPGRARGPAETRPRQLLGGGAIHRNQPPPHHAGQAHGGRLRAAGEPDRPAPRPGRRGPAAGGRHLVRRRHARRPDRTDRLGRNPGLLARAKSASNAGTAPGTPPARNAPPPTRKPGAHCCTSRTAPPRRGAASSSPIPTMSR